MKFSDGNTGHAQVIGIILCIFPNCPNIYYVGSVYYCPGHPSNTVLLDAPKFHVSFQNIISETSQTQNYLKCFLLDLNLA